MLKYVKREKFFPKNIPSSHCGARLYVLQDREAVTHMVMKGRSLVLRTYRMDLDWLVVRITSDSAISTRFVKMTEQCLNMLTKGSFTRVHAVAIIVAIDTTTTASTVAIIYSHF